ncbi:MAG: hypothetical protein ABRQ39_06445 [Candidatus Eremiobacterota bacterium]
MFGIKIEPIYKYPEFKGKFNSSTLQNMSDEFTFFFKAILPELFYYYWIIDRDCFKWPVEFHHLSTYNSDTDEYEDGPMKEILFFFSPIEENNNYYLGLPGLLPEYASYISNDWNCILGFKAKPDSPGEWIKKYWNAKNRGHYVARTVDICFTNIDGAYWEFFTKKEELFESIRYSLQNIEGIRISEQSIENSYGI